MLTYQEREHCNRCGFCLAACPTYRETGVETQSPRGRLAMVAAAAAKTRAISVDSGEAGPLEHLARHLDVDGVDEVAIEG